MAEMVAFTIGDGEARVFVDVADDESGVQRVSRGGDAIRAATATFEAGFGHVRDAAAHAIAQLTALPQRPSTVELEFGVRISAQAGAVFARTGADGHLKVRMVWESHPPAAGASSEAGADDDDDDADANS
ncbi:MULTISPECIES: CU044_2847 family protein [unclassified Streptomyces]|uniref:CU044_2847 family protein n=1 Tax=unclassified Streptomyces TaxID=2593676 RepID=UPI002E2E4A2A|nr:CU044_2847 family protein [Streptomyces sp. NBC_00223]